MTVTRLVNLRHSFALLVQYSYNSACLLTWQDQLVHFVPRVFRMQILRVYYPIGSMTISLYCLHERTIDTR